MKTIKFLLTLVLATFASTSSAELIYLTLHLNGTISGGGTGIQVGTGHSAYYDTVSEILTVDWLLLETVTATGMPEGTSLQQGTSIFDFSTLTSTTQIDSCAVQSGTNICQFLDFTPQDGVISGTWESFNNAYAYGGANYDQDWFIGTEVPVPAAAWLFGSALLGLGAMKRARAA